MLTDILKSFKQIGFTLALFAGGAILQPALASAQTNHARVELVDHHDRDRDARGRNDHRWNDRNWNGRNWDRNHAWRDHDRDYDHRWYTGYPPNYYLYVNPGPQYYAPAPYTPAYNYQYANPY